MFSAILVAELKQNGDKHSLKKCKNLLQRPESLLNSVSKIFWPIIGNTVHLSNDLEAVKKWSLIYNKNIVIRSLDPESLTYVVEFDINTNNAIDSIDLLRTIEDNQDYYHILLNSQ